jgi:hypothetical protein
VFDENIFLFSQLYPNVGAQLHTEILLIPPTLRNTPRHNIVDNHRAHGANPCLEFAVAQVEEISAEEAMELSENLNSVKPAMDKAGAMDLAGSVSDKVPTEPAGHPPSTSEITRSADMIQSSPDPVSHSPSVDLGLDT